MAITGGPSTGILEFARTLLKFQKRGAGTRAGELELAGAGEAITSLATSASSRVPPGYSCSFAPVDPTVARYAARATERVRRNACDGTRGRHAHAHVGDGAARALCAPSPDRPRAHECWGCAFTSPPWHRCYKSISTPRRPPLRCARTPMTKAGGGSSSRPSSQSHCPERAIRALCASTVRHAHAHYARCCRCNRHPRGRCIPHCLLACLPPRRAMRRRRASALSTAPSWGVQSLA